MCGIVAIYAREGEVSASTLERAVARLEHRGPDGQAQWIAPHGRVGLGHARLSIIDLQTGDQPIASEDGHAVIVANGEFYDFERIRDELRADGHTLRTRSDSEIALHLYEDLGAQCLHRLRGEFAFIIWDERRRRLFAARDRFGVKPLFFAVHQGKLYLASEVKALFAAGVPARWDRQALLHGAGFVRPDRTLFAGVRVVPPGHYLLADAHDERLFEYWDLDYPRAGRLSAASDEELIDGFHEVFDDAVRTRLRADVPVGCYLSGGLDSCAVLGVASRHVSRPIRAFTLTFDHADYDEGDIAREMAAHAGAEFVPIPITQDELADSFFDAVASAETFFINAHGVAKYLLSRAVRDHGYKVVLTGEGSDEMLAGYPHWRRDMILHGSEGQDPDEVARLLEQLNEANRVSRGLLLPQEGAEGAPSPLVERLFGFTPSWLEVQLGGAAYRNALFDAEYFGGFGDADPSEPLLSALDVEGQIAGRDAVHKSLYLWAKTALPRYILTVLGDRMEMAHSIEGRVPFLDHHVAEYLRRVPVHLKIRGATEKYILREATRDVLTDTVYRRHKHPFLSPPAALDPGGKLHQLIHDTLSGNGVDAVPWLNATAVRGFLDSVESMDHALRVATDPLLMMLLSGVALQQQLGIES